MSDQTRALTWVFILIAVLVIGLLLIDSQDHPPRRHHTCGEHA